MGFFDGIVKSITGVIGEVLSWVLPVPEIDDINQGALLNKQSNIEPLPVIYGERKVGGVRVFVSTGGSKKNEYLYIALALCEGEVEEIGDIYINDTLSTDSKFSGLVTIQKFVGTDTQTYSTLLAGADDSWGVNHRLQGVAYLAIRFKYDQDVFSGIPEVQAVVKGRKVYDPETQTTAYSSNPALCLRDYLTNARYGKGLSSDLINDASFIAAKQFCDDTVTSYDGAPSQKIFECNAIIDTSRNLFDNVKLIIRGMRGLIPYSNGVYSLIIDKTESSSFDLTPDNITSDLRVTSAGKDKKYNKVVIKFTNPEANWQSDTVFWPPSGSDEEAQFLAEDNNQELSTEITLPTVTNYYSARDLARVACLESRASQLSVKVTATSEALNIVAGDVVRLEQPSLGWVDDARQLFRVTGLQLMESGEVDLTLQKYSQNIYTWDVGTEQPENQITTLPDPTIVTPPSGLSVTAEANIAPDGTTVPYLAISWTEADDAFVDSYQVTITPSIGDAITLNVISTSYDYFVFNTAVTYSVSVRAINSLGIRSTAISQSNISPIIDTTPPAEPSDATVTGEFKQIKVEWTNPTDADLNYIEVKRSGTDVEANAVIIATTKANYFIDGPYDGILTRYYWIRAVDLSLNTSDWVYAGSGSTVQLVAQDFDDAVIGIDFLDASLQGSISNAVSDTVFTQGIADLRQEILNVEVESGDVLNLEDGQDFDIQNLGDVAIYVSQSNQVLNSNIKTIETTITGLENTIADLVSGVSDVYVSDTPPVAGQNGVPDPIPTFSRWYDSDDSNEPYYWDGSQWVSLADPRIASNAAEIVNLQSGLNTANGNISGNSSAISVLETTTINQGNTITSLSSDVTQLESSLTDVESDTSANTSAISGLTTRVTSAENSITANASDITQLETSVTNLQNDTTANTSAISGLDTRVTATETETTANSTAITALETTVNDGTTGVTANANAISGLDTRVTTAEGAITTNASDISALEVTVNDPDNGVQANATAVSNLDVRVTQTEDTLSNVASSEAALQVEFIDLTRIQDETGEVLENESGDEFRLNRPTDVAQATGEATAALDTRITVAEDEIVSQSSDIVSLRNDLTSLSGDVSGNATALSSLTTRVTDNEQGISSNAADIVTLGASLTSLDGEVTNNASAISSLDTRVTQTENTNTSQSQDITALQSDVTDLSAGVSGNSTAINQLTTRVTQTENEITSQASDISSLQSDVADLDSGVTGNATAISGLSTRVTDTENELLSQASDITQLTADIDDLEGDTSANASAISGLDVRVTDNEGDISSQASQITSLTSTVNNNTATISQQASTINGIKAQYTVTIDNNGHVSGFGLVSDIIDGNPTSAFIVNSDQFAIGGAGTITDKYPFVVYTTNQNINKGGTSYTIPAGTYIADAFIQNAAISNAQIQNAAITNAKIGSLAVSTAKIANLAVNNAKIASASITNAKIDDLAVSTVKIQDQAVTIPSSAFTAAEIKTTGQNESTLQQVTFTSTGATVNITFSSKVVQLSYQFGQTSYADIKVYRGSTLLYTLGRILRIDANQQTVLSFTVSDTPPAGSVTYYVKAISPQAGPVFGHEWSLRSLTTLEIKK